MLVSHPWPPSYLLGSRFPIYGTLEWDALRNNPRFQKILAGLQPKTIRKITRNRRGFTLAATALHVAAVEAAVHSLSSTDFGCQRHPARIISSPSGLQTSWGTVTVQHRLKAALCN